VIPAELGLTFQPAEQHRLLPEHGREVQQQRREALDLDALIREPGHQLAQAGLQTLGLGQAAQRGRQAPAQVGLQLGQVGSHGHQLAGPREHGRHQVARLPGAEDLFHTVSVHPAYAVI
jgi:hypothetical protein